jgi:hypothetical protein
MLYIIRERGLAAASFSSQSHPHLLSCLSLEPVATPVSRSAPVAVRSAVQRAACTLCVCRSMLVCDRTRTPHRGMADDIDADAWGAGPKPKNLSVKVKMSRLKAKAKASAPAHAQFLIFFSNFCALALAFICVCVCVYHVSWRYTHLARIDRRGEWRCCYCYSIGYSRKNKTLE